MSTGVVPSKKVSEAPMHGAGIGIWLTTIMEIAGLGVSSWVELSPLPHAASHAAAHPGARNTVHTRKAAKDRRRPPLVTSVYPPPIVVLRLRSRQRQYPAGRAVERTSSSPGSIAEIGRALLFAGADGFLKVLRRQAHVELREPFVLHVRDHAARVQARPEHALGDLDADAAVSDDALGVGVAALEQLAGRDDAGHEPDPLGFRGADVATRQHDVEGAPGADRARQQIADSELARGEPVVDPGGAKVCGLARDADVGGEREAETAADGRAVDGSDHRLVHLADSEDD